jgi:hypothetical protein
MLKFYEAYNKARTTTPKEKFINDLQAIYEQSFENAPNVFYDEIAVEKTYGSNEFQAIPMVRVDSIVNFNTGIVLGDDFKMFIFMPDFPKPVYGMKFKWNDDYWLVINTNNNESTTVSAEVRRCNNILRFFDDKGNKIIEPCIMDYTLRFTKNIENTPIMVSNNEQKIWCQRNTKTVKIKPNDKFLFGAPEQRVAFRVYASGIKNTQNTITGDDLSPTLTEFYMEHYQINPELDDLVNGYANAYSNQFDIRINNSSNIYQKDVSDTLSATVYKNSNIVDMPIKWSSSNTEVATINDDGVLTTLSDGTAILKATLDGNDSVNDSITISVVTEPIIDNYEIIITPDTNYILQNRTTSFDCKLYKNGIQQNNSFVFQNITENVPSDKYIIEVNDDNSFSITNKGLYLNNPVLVKCISGEHEKTLEIILRGLY